MIPVLVDSNILLDVITDDPAWASWSSASLRRAALEGGLVINPLIYAEVSARLLTIEEVDDSLPAEFYQRDELPYAAAFLAGSAFLEYRRRGGMRRSPMPDFYIGAHAAVSGYRLLTRDAGRYRSYFPRLEIIAPGSA